MTLQIGVMVTPAMSSMVDYVVGAERLGATSVWLPEFWAHDALTPLGTLAQVADTIRLGTAIVQLGTRTPAMLADGWIGTSFFCETAEVFTDAIAAGAEEAGRSLEDIELTVSVSCEFTDDVEAVGRRHAEGYAFTFGAMGSSTTNFYNRAFERQGFGPAVAEVQRLWQSGDRDAARRAVPIEIGLRTNLIGPDDEVRRRLRQYRDAGVATLRVNPMGEDLQTCLDGLGHLLDLVADVNAEPSRTP